MQSIAVTILCIIFAIFPLAKASLSQTWIDDVAKTYIENTLQHIPNKKGLSTVLRSAINKELGLIDKYAKILTPDEYNATSSLSYEGIGGVIFKERNRILVMPIQGGALYDAGIKEYHLLHKINSKLASRIGINGINNLLSGKSHKVQFTLKTLSNNNVFKKTHVARSVENRTSNGTRYIRINNFLLNKTAPELKSQLIDFEKQKILPIIDLRNNRGGDLYAASDVASLFLNGEKILFEMKFRNRTEKVTSLPTPRIVEGPIIFLTGPRTASAPEIMLRAIHPHVDMILIGGRTHGKCTSQNSVMLKDGSYLKFTNMIIRGPNGKSCNGIGINPEISMPDVYRTKHLINEAYKEAFRKKYFLCWAKPFKNKNRLDIAKNEVQLAMNLDDMEFRVLKSEPSTVSRRTLCLGSLHKKTDADALLDQYTREIPHYKFRIRLLQSREKIPYTDKH